MRRIAGILAALVTLSFAPGVAAAATVPYPVIVLSAPQTVAPGADITVTGTLMTSDGQPYKHVAVQTSSQCWSPPDSSVAMPDAQTDAQGAFSFSITAGACSTYRLRAYFADPGTNYYADTTVDVAVNRAATTLTVDAPTSAYTSADVPVTVTLTGAGGAPLSGATVTVLRELGTVQQAYWTVTTDAQGSATVTDSITEPGSYEYVAAFNGTAEDANTDGTASPVDITRRPTSITLTGPSDVVVDQPFLVSGTLTGPPLPAQVTLNAPGGFTITVMTDDSGAFEGSVESRIGGSNYVTAVYDQNTLYEQAVHSIQVTAPKLVTSVDLQPVDPVQVGQPANIVGTVTGVTESVDVVVAPQGHPEWGVTVPTAADGSFSRTIVQPWAIPTVGTDTWTVTFAGSDRYTASAGSVGVTYLPLPTTLTVQPHAPVPAGSTFLLVGTLIGPPTGSLVRIRNSEGVVAVVPTGSTGSFTAWVNAPSRAPGTARFDLSFTPPEESTYATASATTYVVQHAVPHLRTIPQRPRTVVGGVFYYRASDDPLFVTTQNPAYRGACHRYVVQRLSHGTWVLVRRSACRALDLSTATSRWRWVASPVRNVTYRVFSEIDAHGLYLANSSEPRLIRFR